MREIVLDTETTGFGAEEHRIVEIGCVELVNRLPTGRIFHHYINPEREIDFGSQKIHGITNEKVANSPKFRDIALDFITFMEDSPLVAHNADFDVTFINAELSRAGHPTLTCEVIDTLAIAKTKLPGQRHNLDALCRYFNVDNSGRTYHGALLDAQLLADVYVELHGGLQGALFGGANPSRSPHGNQTTQNGMQNDTSNPANDISNHQKSPKITATAAEVERHRAFLRQFVAKHQWPESSQ